MATECFNHRPTVFAIDSDSELATVKAALLIAREYWTEDSIVQSAIKLSDAYKAMVAEQVASIKALEARIEDEAW